MTSSRRILLLCIIGMCVGGCDDPSDKIKIRGVVTWNGEPVKRVFVSFKPLDGQHPPEAGAIADGTFSLYALPGKNQVEIYATKESGFNEAMRQPSIVQFIPPQYNEQSTLVEEVSSNGPNSYEYKLSRN